MRRLGLYMLHLPFITHDNNWLEPLVKKILFVISADVIWGFFFFTIKSLFEIQIQCFENNLEKWSKIRLYFKFFKQARIVSFIVKEAYANQLIICEY